MARTNPESAEAGGAFMPLRIEYMDFARELAQASDVSDLEQAYLDAIQRVMPMPMHGVYIFDPQSHAVEHYAATNVSDVFLKRYERIGRSEDPIIQHVMREWSVGYSLAVASPTDWLNHPVYRHVFALHQMVHAAQAPVIIDGDLVGTVAFGTDEDRSPLTSTELARIGLAGQAFGLALAAVRRSERIARHCQLATAALDLCSTPIVITAAPDTPQLNHAARNLLGRTVEGTDLVYRLIARPSSRSRTFARQVCVHWRDGGEATLRATSCDSEVGQDTLITVLECDEPTPAFAGATWTALTERECQVATLVVRGLTDGQIAQRLMISPHTAKQHVRSIYRKVGVRSRVELTTRALTDRPRLPLN